MRCLAAAGAGLALTFAALPALATDAEAFVAAFGAACIPERQSYDGTRRQAQAEGWVMVDPEVHPELAAMMAISETYATDPEYPMEFDYQAFRKSIGGRESFLVVSRAAAEIEGFASIRDIGCYLYDFDATAVINPAAVSALLGADIVQEQIDETISGHLWGPPPGLPGTADTYLTFIPEGSPHAQAGGFTGLVLKFTTAESQPADGQPE